ncbi:histone chaperone domain CHZ-domain-containing protein [Aspergillus ambiguus]|uniref:histone H2A.Z-specific chaperone CHZ1 n=1 Tax=Aspergillus ambiguus TaxID=176160 RepID=UPI003CCE16D5
MGDNNRATLGDPASNAPDAAAFDKGKGKATEDPTMEMSMDEDEESEESENEEMGEDDDDDTGDNLEPISADNIITGGRRTRGKTIDFQEAAEKIQGDDDDDDDDDEEFQPNDDEDHMRH